MSDKQRWPHAQALAVGEALVARLAPHCERIMICGSVRRLKPTVGDVEIVYVPRLRDAVAAVDLFRPAAQVSIVVDVLAALLRDGQIEKRTNVNGNTMWGPSNQFARDVATGVPVDFFATSLPSWWNNVVCRTGGAQNNIRIAGAARGLGYKWHPYGEGFERLTFSGRPTGDVRKMESEEAVFAFARLPFLPPEKRL